MDKLVSIVIINWNNKDYLERCIESINNQTYSNKEIIFIDNDSKDGSFDFFKEKFGDKKYILVNNKENLGYSGAANQGIKLSNGEYIMIINPDIIMEEDFIEKLCLFVEEDSEIGALSGKLLKYDFKNDKKLNIIDSAGIIIYKDRTCIDRGQNDEDLGQYNTTERVFGVCGAAPFYKRSALEKIKIENEYFDEDFFAYKEDIDLSWRLNKAGYKCVYYPKAIAYHGRGLGGTKGGMVNLIKHRRKQSKFLRGLSFRNQLLMLFKNEEGESYKRDKVRIYSRIIKTVLFSALFEQFNFRYLKQAIKLRKKMILKKRAFNKQLGNIEFDIKDLTNM
jgi:GT2 family glycosyltransferase